MSLDLDAIHSLAPDRAFSLAGKAAVVTGAAGGIGRWLAAGLGAAGARVLVTDLEQEPLDDLVALLAAAGIEAVAHACDLAEDEAPSRIVSAAVDRLGALDVLVNNAAVNRRMPILEMDPDTWD